MPTQYLLPDLCDAYPEKVNVVAPQFNSYGGKQSYHGQIVTIKCHEDNSLVAEQVDRNGDGKVLVVDGGGSYAAVSWAIILPLKLSRIDGRASLCTDAFGMSTRSVKWILACMHYIPTR